MSNLELILVRSQHKIEAPVDLLDIKTGEVSELILCKPRKQSSENYKVTGAEFELRSKIPGGKTQILELVAWRSRAKDRKQCWKQLIALQQSLYQDLGPNDLVVRLATGSIWVSEFCRAGFHLAGTLPARNIEITIAGILPRLPIDRLLGDDLAPAFIMGCPNPNLLAQARALGASGIPVHALLTRGESPLVAHLSRWIFRVYDLRSSSKQAVVETIRRAAYAYSSKPVLFFAGDSDLDFSAAIWDEIAHWVTPVTEPLKASKLNDKQRQVSLMQEAGIPLPATVFVSSLKELEMNLGRLRFPVIVRPAEHRRKGSFPGKVLIAETADELRSRLVPVFHVNAVELVLQELIPGGTKNIVYAVGQCDASGNSATVLTGRKVYEYPIGRTCIGETTQDPTLEELAQSTFRAFGLGGVLGVEFKRDDRDGAYYYIETNFRPDNFVAISEAAGNNMLVAAYLECLQLPLKYRPLGTVHAVWRDLSLVILRRMALAPVPHMSRRRLGRVVDAVWRWDDPGPAIVWWLIKAIRLLKKCIRRG